MDFELTPEIVDQIIFAMEDQEQEFLVDSGTGEIVAGDTEAGPGPGSLVRPPQWRPVDGYRLMEKFVATLRNPILREELRGALSSGRGVFRSFKDTLKRSKEIERLWFLFKEREMKRIVYEWYNAHREARGLEKQELEEEETDELVLSDFSLELWAGDDECALVELDKAGYRDTHPSASEQEVATLCASRRFPLEGPDSLVVTARTPTSELAGLIWGTRSEISQPFAWQLVQLSIAKEYRGLGLGQALVDMFARECQAREGLRMEVCLEEPTLYLSDFFDEMGFEVVSKTYALDLKQWVGED